MSSYVDIVLNAVSKIFKTENYAYCYLFTMKGKQFKMDFYQKILRSNERNTEVFNFLEKSFFDL